MKFEIEPQRYLFPALSCAALLTCSMPAAADDYFLKFDGIDGSSAVKGHEKAIEFDSFNWGLSISHTLSGGGAVGKPVFSDFSWMQELDASTNGLFSSASSGKSIKNAVVDFVTTSGGTSNTYFKMTFDNVFITSLDYSGSGGSRVGLAGSFAYDKVTLDYWAQDKTGKFVKLESASYDIGKGTGSIPAVASVFALGMAGPQTLAVPEPETYAMLLAGLGVLGAVARRRRSVV